MNEPDTIKEDRFTLKKDRLKKEKKFMVQLIKLCERYQMIFAARGLHAPHRNIKIYEWEIGDMKKYYGEL